MKKRFLTSIFLIILVVLFFSWNRSFTVFILTVLILDLYVQFGLKGTKRFFKKHKKIKIFNLFYNELESLERIQKGSVAGNGVVEVNLSPTVGSIAFFGSIFLAIPIFLTILLGYFVLTEIFVSNIINYANILTFLILGPGLLVFGVFFMNRAGGKIKANKNKLIVMPLIPLTSRTKAIDLSRVENIRVSTIRAMVSGVSHCPKVEIFAPNRKIVFTMEIYNVFQIEKFLGFLKSNNKLKGKVNFDKKLSVF